MSKRCSAGLHSYRHVSLKTLPDPLGWQESWWWTRRCTRCRLERSKVVYRVPRLIRTHEWKNNDA